jgi:hypothetical protein
MTGGTPGEPSTIESEEPPELDVLPPELLQPASAAPATTMMAVTAVSRCRSGFFAMACPFFQQFQC